MNDENSCEHSFEKTISRSFLAERCIKCGMYVFHNFVGYQAYKGFAKSQEEAERIALFNDEKYDHYVSGMLADCTCDYEPSMGYYKGNQ